MQGCGVRLEVEGGGSHAGPPNLGEGTVTDTVPVDRSTLSKPLSGLPFLALLVRTEGPQPHVPPTPYLSGGNPIIPPRGPVVSALNRVNYRVPNPKVGRSRLPASTVSRTVTCPT